MTTTVFFTPCWKNVWRNGWLALLLACALAGLAQAQTAGAPGAADITELHLERSEGDLMLSANVQFQLTEQVEGRKVLTGMLKGVDGDRIAIDLPKHGLMTIGFDQVGNAKLVLTDALIAASAAASGLPDQDGLGEDDDEEDASSSDAPTPATRN